MHYPSIYGHNFPARQVRFRPRSSPGYTYPDLFEETRIKLYLSISVYKRLFRPNSALRSLRFPRPRQNTTGEGISPTGQILRNLHDAKMSSRRCNSGPGGEERARVPRFDSLPAAAGWVGGGGEGPREAQQPRDPSRGSVHRSPPRRSHRRAAQRPRERAAASRSRAPPPRSLWKPPAAVVVARSSVAEDSARPPAHTLPACLPRSLPWRRAKAKAGCGPAPLAAAGGSSGGSSSGCGLGGSSSRSGSSAPTPPSFGVRGSALRRAAPPLQLGHVGAQSVVGAAGHLGRR